MNSGYYLKNFQGDPSPMSPLNTPLIHNMIWQFIYYIGTCRRQMQYITISNRVK